MHSRQGEPLVPVVTTVVHGVEDEAGVACCILHLHHDVHGAVGHDLHDAAAAVHEGVGLTSAEVEEADGLRSAVVTGLAIGDGLDVARHAVVGDVIRRQVAGLRGRHGQGHFAVTVLDVGRSTGCRNLDEVEDVVHTVAVVITTGVLHRLTIVDVTGVRELRSNGVEHHDVLVGVRRILIAAVVRDHGRPEAGDHIASLDGAVVAFATVTDGGGEELGVGTVTLREHLGEDLTVDGSVGRDLRHEHAAVGTGEAIGISVQGEPGTTELTVEHDVTAVLEVIAPVASDVDCALTCAEVRLLVKTDGHVAVVLELREPTV